MKIMLVDETQVLLDDADFETLAGLRWRLAKNGYVRRFQSVGGTLKCFLLHRQILGLVEGDGLMGDHINGNPLDNRRSNLRVVNAAQSSANVKARSATGYRGVYPSGSRFVAKVSTRPKSVHLGSFETAEEAAQVVHEWRVLNLPGYVDRPDARRVALWGSSPTSSGSTSARASPASG